MSEALFGGFEALPAHPDPKGRLSADRRRTLRQRRDVANGRHPLTGGKTYPELGTCGDCRFRALVDHHSRTYPKCWWRPNRDDREYDFPPPFHSNGAASDVRAWWPACEHHELGDPKVSPDAMRSRQGCDNG